MTLYYSMVFALLVFEMTVFVSLIVPLPYKVKRGLFMFLATNPIVAKIQYGMKITFIFITVLFLDSVNRVYRVQVELAQAKQAGAAAGAVAGTERMEVQARKFYSQRNMYLCGFTLFLSLILNRTYIMILETLRLEAELKELKGEQPKGKDSGSAGLGEAGNIGEIGRLKKELAKRDRDIDTLKKQSEGLSNEYNRMGDKYIAQDPVPKKDR